MTDYDYTKSNGDVLRVRRFLDDKILVKVEHGTGHTAGITIHAGDAPALALAILEAAGIDPGDGQTGTEYTRVAAHYLKQHKKELSEAQEREAEDAKVREFEIATYGDLLVMRDQPLTDYRRERYRAARDYFKES